MPTARDNQEPTSVINQVIGKWFFCFCLWMSSFEGLNRRVKSCSLKPELFTLKTAFSPFSVSHRFHLFCCRYSLCHTADLSFSPIQKYQSVSGFNTRETRNRHLKLFRDRDERRTQHLHLYWRMRLQTRNTQNTTDSRSTEKNQKQLFFFFPFTSE